MEFAFINDTLSVGLKSSHSTNGEGKDRVAKVIPFEDVLCEGEGCILQSATVNMQFTICSKVIRLIISF